MLMPEGAIWNPNVYIDGESIGRGPLQFSEPPFFRDLLINVHDAIMRDMDWTVRALSQPARRSWSDSQLTPLNQARTGVEKRLEQLLSAMAVVDHRYLAYMTGCGYLRLGCSRGEPLSDGEFAF